ncbi:uncharacterized protein LOC131436589 isoform X2 [Malaya genurostris]|uniref:uncharacterized protein LOC131436589 isoform X2 n=1 Tax=Malaya genurostris TaxID=325434 RepID=UPI0026F3A43B|nr:uncharacterized protein LOC131436589 isoform X2 [Malaya genurostris]
MEYRETTRWFLKRLHQNEHLIVNIASETDISRSPRSVIPLNRASFQHISKKHCIITCVDGVATLTDETSTSGTYVNNRRLSRETPGSVILNEDDLIGIGSPCFQQQTFYQNNRHVLLYRVCKDRNRVIRDGDVDTILSSDEEAEPILRRVPQEVPPNVPKPEEEQQYRVLENIDLSSDDDDVVVLDSGKRIAKLEEVIFVETERQAKEIENKQQIQAELERDNERRQKHEEERNREKAKSIAAERLKVEETEQFGNDNDQNREKESIKIVQNADAVRTKDDNATLERVHRMVETTGTKIQPLQQETQNKQQTETSITREEHRTDRKNTENNTDDERCGNKNDTEIKTDRADKHHLKLNEDMQVKLKERRKSITNKDRYRNDRKRDKHKSYHSKDKQSHREKDEKGHRDHRNHKSSHSSHSSRSDRKRHDRKKEERIPIKQDEVIELDPIEELFKDSLALSCPEETSIPIISIDSESDDENDFSEKKYSQNYYRQIKQEAQEVDLLNDEPQMVDKLASDVPVLGHTLDNFFTSDSETIYISEDDEDEQTLEDSKRWFMRLSQKNSPLRTKPNNIEHNVKNPDVSDTSVSRLKVTANCNGITPLNAKVSDIQSCLRLPISEHEAKNLGQQSAIETTVSKHSDDSSSKQPLPLKLGSNSPKRKRNLSDVSPLLDFDVVQKDDDGKINLDDSFFSSFLELVDPPEQIADDSYKPPETKKQKISDKFMVEPDNSRDHQKSLDTGSSVSAANIAKAAGLKPTLSDSARHGVNEKNSNSASNAWIKRKVPFVEPHCILKRRMSTNNGASSSKISSLKKQSPTRKSGHSNETRKEKLKAIQSAKPPSSDRDTKGSKKATIPKVKFTPCNRGAFLVEDVSCLNKTNNENQSASTNGADEKFICTQSTSLENLPVVETMIEEALSRAPKLTFTSVARVSNVASSAPIFKIPKHRPPTVPKPASTTDDTINTLLNTIEEPIAILTAPEVAEPVVSSNSISSSIISSSDGPKSILIRPDNPSRKRSNRVTWNETLSETRVFQIDDGNDLCVKTKYYREDNECRNMSLVNCQNDIILEITSWDANWFDNPSEASICEGKLLPMVEQYKDFEDYKRIVLPILKIELFHDILAQYGELKKTVQKSLQMKLNQIHSQSRTFVLNCSVENSTHQSINNKDYVLIMFTDKSTGKELRVPAVVTTRRQLIQYAENGVKFYHCSLETAKTPLSQRIRDGSGENFRILSVTQINLHMRQFQVLFNLQSSPLLENILSPRSNFYSTNNPVDRRSYKGKEVLNARQGDILLNVFRQCLDIAQPNIMLIQGPPGTGKSRLISNLIMQIHRGAPNNKRLKILVCAQSNTAVDVIVLKLIKLFRLLAKDEQSNILRTGTGNKINHECRMVFLDDLARKQVNEQIKRRKLRDEDPVFETFYLERETLDRKIKYLQANANSHNGLANEDLNQLQDKLNRINQLLPNNINDIDLHDKNRRHMEIAAKKQLVSKADIVCTTLGSCGALMEYNQSLKFDVCIIDEATQCTEIASFTPLQYGVRKLILVGDVKQLPPFVFGKESAEAGLKNSLFSRIQSSFIGTQLEGVKMLTTQYRMHPDIVKWPNEFFYEGKLASDLEATKCDEFPFKPYTVFSLDYQQNQTQTEHQIYNNDEIQFVLKLLSEIIKFCERHITIAIITPYTRHKRECEKYLQQKKITQVSVLSIDSVQGQEFDVVIISLARSIGTGFLESPQRLNVALTRARKCLVLCGNFSELQDTDVWSALLKDAKDRNLFYHIEDDDEYDDVDSFVERVMRNLRKNTPT